MVSFPRILHMYILITKLISLMIMFCACNPSLKAQILVSRPKS